MNNSRFIYIAMMFMLLLSSSLGVFAVVVPLDGTQRVGGDRQWSYVDEPVSIAGKTYQGWGCVTDGTLTHRMLGTVVFDITGATRFTAYAGLRDTWIGDDGAVAIEVDGKLINRVARKSGDTAVFINLALKNAKRLAIRMAPSILLATPTLYDDRTLLKITTLPSGAEVFIDGERKGISPLEIEIPTSEIVNEQTVMVEARNTKIACKIRAKVTLVPKEKTSILLNLKDGAEMIFIPAGKFLMGNPFGNEQPAHEVTLSGYWIYKYEVTVAQYLVFCSATGHALPKFPSGYSWTGKTSWADAALQQHPIVNVRWYDAKAYADWAGVQLPTEAQWEYAARGPQGRNYPWGGTATAADEYNGWDQTKCANYDNSASQNISTWPVGSFPRGVSWCGAQDLAGNALEWCADWYGSYSSSSVTNPTGPATGSYRVLRGGAWGNGYGIGNYFYRGADRSYDYPDDWDGYVGFRCASVSPGL